ncbi:MAG: hypothetical protein ABFD49_11120 [Armatimonadota bacterium]|nr:hypothetical protein [bacterium]
MTLNLQPATINDEIAQNVRVISRTRRGSQPLDRQLGINGELVDTAGTRGQALYAAAVIDTLPQQEPRVVIKQVRFDGDAAAAQYSPVIEYEVKQ